MKIATNIKNFLEPKLQLHNISCKNFAEKSNIIYNTVCKILTCQHPNTHIITIIKIADYFNCSIDEVLGRIDYIESYKFHDLNTVLNNYNRHLQQFVLTKIHEHHLNPYKLSQDLGFHNSVIPVFIKDHNNKKTVRTPVIIAIAEHFNISIDKMINRAI